jgi:hypothetical protein
MRGFDSRRGLHRFAEALAKAIKARMAELVYAHDLKSCLERDVGSIPTLGTEAKESLLK